MPASAITVRSNLNPGDLGRVIALHGTAYEGETVHFGLTFEAYVAKTIAEFVIDNGAARKVFLAERGPDLVGCAAMVERRARGALPPPLKREGLRPRLRSSRSRPWPKGRVQSR